MLVLCLLSKAFSGSCMLNCICVFECLQNDNNNKQCTANIVTLHGYRKGWGWCVQYRCRDNVMKILLLWNWNCSLYYATPNVWKRIWKSSTRLVFSINVRSKKNCQVRHVQVYKMCKCWAWFPLLWPFVVLSYLWATHNLYFWTFLWNFSFFSLSLLTFGTFFSLGAFRFPANWWLRLESCRDLGTFGRAP